MLKVLMKKQFMECFRSYFVKQKTGKPRSKKQTITLFVLFGVLLLFISGSFFGMASFFALSFMGTPYSYLFYVILGILAILLGTFGSVFNTFSSMYLAKDNEFLLSMPIPMSTILISRLSLEYVLSLLYSAIVWIPSVLCGFIFSGFRILPLVFGLLMTFILALFVTVITSILGFVIAKISTKLKSKAVLSVLIAIVAMGLYYVFAFRMQYFMNMLVQHTELIADGIKKYLFLLHMFGKGVDGNVLFYFLFVLIVLLLTALTVFVLSKTYYQTILKVNVNSKKKTKKESKVKKNNVKSALLKREFKHFFSSPTYMLNCGLSAVILPVAVIFMIYKSKDLFTALSVVEIPFLDLLKAFPILLFISGAVIMSMDCLTVPSISLEGKNLWVLQSMPIRGRDVLHSKMNLHLCVNGIPSFVSMLVLLIAMKMDFITVILVTLSVSVYVYLTGAFGLVLGLHHANLTWTSEAIPIKQNISVLFGMLINLGLCIIPGFMGLALSVLLDVRIILSVILLIYVFLSVILYRWINKKGEKLFNSL